MIYTITFSPSIDYIINTSDDFDDNNLNRISDYELLPGGKGINASIILKRINFDNKAITFLGGNTKSLFLNLLEKENIELLNFESKNSTRINVKMFANNTNFEINGPRAKINKEQYDKLINFINMLNSDDFILIMGICDEFYLEKIIKTIYDKKIKFVLDIDSKIVLSLLKYNPLIIKPNRSELAYLLNKELKDLEDIKIGMIKLQNWGCKYIMVSDGKNGSYFLDKNQNFYQIKLKKEFEIISTVGAGDTLISSFICLYEKTNNLFESLKQATSLSIGTSTTRFLANETDLNKYVSFVDVIKLG